MARDQNPLAGVLLVGTALALVCVSACSADYEPPACRARRGSAEVTADPTICPKIATYSVSPSETQVGQLITLSASGVSKTGEALVLTWSASSGAVTDGTTPNTTYRCASPGLVTLTLTVSNGRCGESSTVTVECLQ